MPRDPQLRAELLEMVEEQQAAAEALFARLEADSALSDELDRLLADPTTPLIRAIDDWPEAPPEARALLDVNERHTEQLAAIVHEHGWPGLRLVGADATEAAWLLAQHADRANGERRGWLPALREAVTSGDADPRHLAVLTDRVAAVDGEPQVYGELASAGGDGELDFAIPVADPAGPDDRRQAIGLTRLAEDITWQSNDEPVPGGSPVAGWPIVLEGHVSAEAALVAGVRHVHRIWARRPGDRRLARLRALARERGVLIDEVEPELIDELATGRTHGGVVALVGPRRTLSVHSLLAEVGERALVVMLDGIEDPFNFGQAVRALYAAGVNGIVVRRSWETAAGTVARASAGTSELMPTATAESAEAAATACRLRGLRVACAVADRDAPELHEVDLTGGVFVLIGGERRGVTRSFVDEADVRLRIGYGRHDAPELGTAAAAAIVGFEALRQRRST